MRLILQKIYENADPKLARRKLHAGCRWVAGKSAPLLFAAMVKTAKMVERHIGGVMARPLNRVTNVFLEGLNSVFSADKRKARGFRSTKSLTTMLCFTAECLDLPATH
jgi:transposase